MVLRWLHENRQMSLQAIRNNLVEYTNQQRTFSDETIGKYINTLKKLGCHITRQQNGKTDSSTCYRLKTSPFPIELSAEDVDISERLLTALEQHSTPLLLKDYHEFLQSLCWHCSLDKGLPSAVSPDMSLRSRLQKHSEKFQHYCKQAFNLEVQYQDENNRQILSLQIEPYTTVERKNRLYLLAMDIHTGQQKILLTDRIIAVHQLPSKNKRKLSLTHVMFSLYGRLASSYRLYPGEKIIFKGRQELHIKSSVLEVESLLQRLMKYGVSCQVLAPQTLRTTIQNRIKQKILLLNN